MNRSFITRRTARMKKPLDRALRPAVCSFLDIYGKVADRCFAGHAGPACSEDTHARAAARLRYRGPYPKGFERRPPGGRGLAVPGAAPHRAGWLDSLRMGRL